MQGPPFYARPLGARPGLPGPLAAGPGPPGMVAAQEPLFPVDPGAYLPKGPTDLPRPPPGVHPPLTAIVLGTEYELGKLVVRELVKQPIFVHVWALAEVPMIAADFGLTPEDAERVTIVTVPYDVMEDAIQPVLEKALRLVAFCCLGLTRKDSCAPMEYHRINYSLPLRFVTKILEGEIMRVCVLSVKDADMEGRFSSAAATLRGIMEEAIMDLLSDDLFRTLFLWKHLEPGVAFFQAPLMITDGLKVEGEWRGLHSTEDGGISRKELAKQRAALRFGLGPSIALRTGDVAKAMVVEARDFVLLTDSEDPGILGEMMQMLRYAVEPEEIKALAEKAEEEEEEGLDVVIPDEERLVRRLDAHEYYHSEDHRFGGRAHYGRHAALSARSGGTGYHPGEMRNSHHRSAHGAFLPDSDVGGHHGEGRELVNRISRAVRGSRGRSTEDSRSVGRHQSGGNRHPRGRAHHRGGSGHHRTRRQERIDEEDIRRLENQRGGIIVRAGSGLERRHSLGSYPFRGGMLRGTSQQRMPAQEIEEGEGRRPLENGPRRLPRGLGGIHHRGSVPYEGSLHSRRRQERIDDNDIRYLEYQRSRHGDVPLLPGSGRFEGGGPVVPFDPHGEGEGFDTQSRMHELDGVIGTETPRWRRSLITDPDFQPGGLGYMNEMRMWSGVGGLTARDSFPLRSEEAAALQERLIGTNGLQPANAAGYSGALGAEGSSAVPPVPRGRFRGAYGGFGGGHPLLREMGRQELLARSARLPAEQIGSIPPNMYGPAPDGVSMVDGPNYPGDIAGNRYSRDPSLHTGRHRSGGPRHRKPDGDLVSFENTYGPPQHVESRARERRQSNPRLQEPHIADSSPTSLLPSGEALERAVGSRHERARPSRLGGRAEEEEALYRAHLERERRRPLESASMMSPDSEGSDDGRRNSGNLSDERGDGGGIARAPDRDPRRRHGGSRGEAVREGLWRLAERALGPQIARGRDDPIVAI